VSLLVRIWRALGIAQTVLSVGLGAILFLGNVQNMGSTYYPDADHLTLLGGLLILFSPLGLLVPFTIAEALQRSEQIAADLARLAGKSES
jgi:hypothetical protein